MFKQMSIARQRYMLLNRVTWVDPSFLIILKIIERQCKDQTEDKMNQMIHRVYTIHSNKIISRLRKMKNPDKI